MSNFYRGPSIDASYHVLVHLAKQFQRRRLKYEKLTDDDRMQILVDMLYNITRRSTCPLDISICRRDDIFLLCLIVYYIIF
jgi:hypothetical protein